MIYLKVSLVLGGDPYDSARIEGIETFVRDAIADGLALEYEHVTVERLPCDVAMGGSFVCDQPSGHDGLHSGGQSFLAEAQA